MQRPSYSKWSEKKHNATKHIYIHVASPIALISLRVCYFLRHTLWFSTRVCVDQDLRPAKTDEQIEMSDSRLSCLRGLILPTSFLPRDAMHPRYSHGPVSVCLSQVGVLLKRLNVGSHKQHHTIAQGLVSALLRGNWQDFNWHDASRGPSAIAELLVNSGVSGGRWTLTRWPRSSMSSLTLEWITVTL